MVMGYAGGSGVEILPFIKIRRLQRLTCLDICRTLANAETATAGPVPCFQDHTAISQLAQLIGCGHAQKCSITRLYSFIAPATPPFSRLPIILQLLDLLLKVSPFPFIGVPYKEICAHRSSIRQGKAADLLILGADPVADLANLRKLEGVIHRGVLMRH